MFGWLLTRDAPRARELDRDALLFAAGVWFAEFAQWFLRSWSNGSLERPLQVLEKFSYNTVTFALTCGIWLILRRRGPFTAWSFIRGSAPLVVLASGLNTVLGWLLFYHFFITPADRADPSNFDWIAIAPQPLSYLWVFFCWACFVATLVGADEARARERALAESHRELQEARLRALRNQIHPHLVFNSLNAVQALLEAERLEEARHTLDMLSRFLRNTLEASTEGLTLLSREIDTQRVYLEIEKVRFADRLSVRFDVDPRVEQALVPSLSLQPLVENAIKHGLQRAVDGAGITIGARRDGDALRLWVEDDAGAEPGPRSGQGFGIGLANTRARLQTLYGDRALLSAGPVEGVWRSEIRLPYEVEIPARGAPA